MHASVSEQRSVTDPSKDPPRTWGGLLVYAALVVVTIGVMLAVTYPIVAAAGFSGVIIGALATRMAHRLPYRRERSLEDSTDRVRTAS